MKRLLTALVTTIAMISPTLAASGSTVTGYEFFNSSAGYWHIGGYTGDTGGLDPACYAEYVFQDSSVFQLIKNLETGELYMWLQNTTWNIADAPGQYDMILNMRHSDGSIGPASGKYTYDLINKNTIGIYGLNIEEFIPDFMEASQIDMIMSGTIENAYIPLDSSFEATEVLSQCIDVANQVKLNF